MLPQTRLEPVSPVSLAKPSPAEPGLLSTTNGFATHAEVVYAGSRGSHSLVTNNPHAVSQYDVACVGVSQQTH